MTSADPHAFTHPIRATVFFNRRFRIAVGQFGVGFFEGPFDLTGYFVEHVSITFGRTPGGTVHIPSYSSGPVERVHIHYREREAYGMRTDLPENFRTLYAEELRGRLLTGDQLIEEFLIPRGIPYELPMGCQRTPTSDVKGSEYLKILELRLSLNTPCKTRKAPSSASKQA